MIPRMKATDDEWLRWIDREFPFAPGMERWLITRQPHQRGQVGSRRELEDLRGIRDRSMAVMLARLWLNANRSEARAMSESGDV